MSRASLPPRRGRLRRSAAGLAVALVVPLTMGVSCDPGENQEDQGDQVEQQEDQEDDGGEEQEEDGD